MVPIGSCNGAGCVYHSSTQGLRRNSLYRHDHPVAGASETVNNAVGVALARLDVGLALPRAPSGARPMPSAVHRSKVSRVYRVHDFGLISRQTRDVTLANTLAIGAGYR